MTSQDIKYGYAKKECEDVPEIPEEMMEPPRNIDWVFVRRQAVKAILFPILILGLRWW
jgi:hypothetical protein